MRTPLALTVPRLPSSSRDTVDVMSISAKHMSLVELTTAARTTYYRFTDWTA